MPKRILLIGGPSTGKSTLLNHFKSLGYPCMDEISREVTRRAKDEGIDQLFLEKPLLFSELLRDARITQFRLSATLSSDIVFIDRGIPDTVAYMDFIGQQYPEAFVEACKKYVYEEVFILPLWKEIHTTDNERYENYEEAQEIQQHLRATYRKFGYRPIEVPTGAIEDRAQFILKKLAI